MLALLPSTRKNKKWMVQNPFDQDKFVHFGARGMSDYTVHKDPERKQRYIRRASKIKDKNGFAIHNPESPAFWSLVLLWNKPSLAESMRDVERRFGYKIRLYN